MYFGTLSPYPLRNNSQHPIGSLIGIVILINKTQEMSFSIQEHFVFSHCSNMFCFSPNTSLPISYYHHSQLFDLLCYCGKWHPDILESSRVSVP